jgi:hypothetical protein
MVTHGCRSLLTFIIGLGLTMTGLLGMPAAAEPPAADDATAGAKATPAELAEPESVDVVITTPDGGVVGGTVTLYQWQDAEGYFDSYVDRYIAAASSPHTETFSVPAGQYFAAFEDDTDSYAPGWADGAVGPAADPDDPGVVEVTASAGATTTIDLAALPSRVPVTGSVEDASGAGLADISVEARTGGDGDVVADVSTDENGDYQLTLRPGSYELVFADQKDDFEGTSVSIAVTASGLAVPTVTLAPVGRWEVDGRILGAGGLPINGASVELVRLYGSPGNWNSSAYVDDALTDGQGHYVFEGVRENGHFTVVADAEGYLRQVMGGGSDLFEATSFSPTADVTNPDISLTEAGSVSGVVAGPEGPAAGVQVVLHRYDDDDATFDSLDSDVTSSSGSYSFEIDRVGDYALFFSGSQVEPPLASAWLEGNSTPAGPTAPGVISVTDSSAHLVRNKTLPLSQVATGRLSDQAGNGLSSGSVVAYVQVVDEGETYWNQYDSDVTDANGAFALAVPPSSVVTFRFARAGYIAQFLGGGSSLPAVATEQSSRTTGATGDLAVGDIALAPFASKLGKVAGQKLAYCNDNVLLPNDDGSTGAVGIPFDLRFFGTSYQQLYVNNNGNVTFGGRLGQFTPSDLTTGTDLPIIAPFFADVDTSGPGSNVVTYGASPDGNTFCVNWADVGYYDEHDDKLNTFQLLLTKNTSGAGRVAGDFDITFNYDELLWETGDASQGEDGFGGTSAAAGFSAGSGVSGTYVQLPGSLVNGALLDGGPNALIGSSQNSSQVGRYVFEVRNEGVTTTLGNLTGTVVEDDGGEPVVNAYVQACRSSGTSCSYADTNASGGYSFTAIPAGSYTLRVWPPDDDLFDGGGTATVVGGETTTVPAIRLDAPTPMPQNVALTHTAVTESGVPSVFYGDPLQFRLTGCASVPSPTYTVTLASGLVIRDHLPMSESPAGTYTATIAPLSPNTGGAEISTNIPSTCGGQPVEFNVYIDPSGIVTSQYGIPLPGVSMTLLRSDTADGDYVMVPDGSTIMSESNRHNPTTTDATGYFRWDVQVGWYKVRAETANCTTVTSPSMQVPPERVDLVVKMTCTGPVPAPTTAPSVTGTPTVGSTIIAQPAVWAGPIVATGVELLRNGTPLPSASHVMTVADIGAVFTARATGQRPDYVTEGGTGQTVAFAPVTATSASVTGQPAVAPAAPTGPAVPAVPAVPAAPAGVISNPVKPKLSGSAKVGKTLTLKPGTFTAPGVTLTYQWFVNGKAVKPRGTALKLTAKYLGKKIYAVVTATASGYTALVVATKAKKVKAAP